MNTLTPTSAAIEELRNSKDPADGRRTAEQLHAIVDGLKRCRTLDEVATAAGLTPEAILDDVATFGTWLSHVRGTATAEIIEAKDVDQLILSNDIDGVVIIPPGFERSAGHGRDVSRSLAIIVEADPDDTVVSRYIARKYPSDTTVLTFPVVTTVVKFDELERLDEIAEVSTSQAFRSKVIQAYDMLATAVGDANTAVKQLVPLTSADEDTVLAELDTLASIASKISWLQPREAQQLEKTVEYTRSHPDGVSTLMANLNTLGRLIQATPETWRVERVGDLNHGQVQSIARAAGLSIEGVSRAEETEIRQRLTKLGLKSDADRLVPEGVRATLAGVSDAFWEAMEARASGDPTWASMLVDAYSEAEMR